jgi:hypothetical protein
MSNTDWNILLWIQSTNNYINTAFVLGGWGEAQEVWMLNTKCSKE